MRIPLGKVQILSDCLASMSLFTAVDFVNSLFTPRRAVPFFCKTFVKRMFAHVKKREIKRNITNERETKEHPLSALRGYRGEMRDW